MKKIILSLFTLLALGEGVNAQKVTVPDVYATPGQIVAFVVNLDEGKDATYTAFQFDVQFPATGFTTTGAYTVSESWAAPVSASVGTVEEGVATVPFSSENKINGTKVNYLVSVSFKVDESVAAGDYDVTLKNIFFGYNTSDKDFPADCSFKVHVLSGVDVVLDENSPIAPENTVTPVNIKVFRTINANEWSTICLPFEMSQEQWENAFGTDAEIRRLTSYTKDDDNIKVTFGNKLAANKMVANRPYIIKTSKEITSFTTNSTINVTAGKDSKLVYDAEEDDNVEVAYSQGIYKAGTILPNNSVFLSNGEFWYSKGKTLSKAFRAYFWFKDAVASAPLLMDFEDGNTTGISSVKVDENNGAYYNLSGQRVESLKKGQIYIKNNKKVVVK